VYQCNAKKTKAMLKILFSPQTGAMKVGLKENIPPG